MNCFLDNIFCNRQTNATCFSQQKKNATYFILIPNILLSQKKKKIPTFKL